MRRRPRRSGQALLIVLLALALLFALGIPFLLAGRLRAVAAREGFDRARARVAADSATLHSLVRESASHPAVDSTPLWDAASEWDPAAAGPLPAALGPDWEGTHQSWGVEAEALQGRVSLHSAPVVLLQNLLRPCFVTEDVDYRSGELPVTSTAGFPDEGLLFLGSYVLRYGARLESSFTEIAPDEEPPEDLTSTRFRAGTSVVDPRVYNLALARLRRGRHQPPEFWSDLLALDVTGAGLLPAEDAARLQQLACLRAGGYGTADWEPAIYLREPPDPEVPESVRISDPGAVSQGTILRIEPETGEPLDSFVVVASPRAASALLPGPLPPDFEPWATRIHPLRREPVDLNSAPAAVLEALAAGVRWRSDAVPAVSTRSLRGNPGRDWISPREAREFAARVVRARPLRGPEDLWRRVLQPMAEEGALSDFEALALHLNGLDPNDGALAQSTLPFGYRSGDRYAQRVDAAVRSRLGATLARHAERQVVAAAPSGPLLRIWHTQEFFEDAGRFGRGLHGVVTLPRNLGRLGGEHQFRDPLTLRAGLFDPTGLMAPSGEEDESAVIPAPAREADSFGPNGFGRTEHFDLEPSPLGYDVRERGPMRSALLDWNIPVAAQSTSFPVDPVTGLPSAGSSVEPLHLQGWFEMPADLSDGFLFDVAAAELDRNRVVAALERGTLVVRAYDGAGDDPLDEEGLLQAQEVRLDPLDYPLAGRWVHLSVLLRGVGPRALQVAADGVPRGRVRGLTWLARALPGYAPGDPDPDIVVESTEGFPNRGAIRIGAEVIEYSGKTPNSFITRRTVGAAGYLGGRAAREATDTLVGSLDTAHPRGAAVELYGYSAVLESQIPPGGGALSGDLGPFSMAVAVQGPETINFTTPMGFSRTLGQGIGCGYVGPLELAPAYAGDPYFAETFQSDGGYALLFQNPATADGVNPLLDAKGCRLGGVELIQYGSRQGTTLTITQRAVSSPGLSSAPPVVYQPGRGATFVTEWAPDIADSQGTPLAELPEWRVFVLPLSIKGRGVSPATYLPAGGSFSEFVQVTHDGDASLTEWVRYDRILNGAFLRDDWGAISNAIGTYIVQERIQIPEEPPRGGDDAGLGGDSDSDSGAGAPGQGQGRNDYAFVRKIGEPVQNRAAALENVRLALDFRGVMNTYDHAHAAGARLVPVFHTVRGIGAWSGFVGRLDRVAVLQPGSQLPPSWFTVQWAAPSRPDGRLVQNVTYVGFLEDPGLPFLAAVPLPNLDDVAVDVRRLPRLVKFPSGERPAGLEVLVLGGDASGGGASFRGRLDEVSLHASGGMGPASAPAARGGFVLREDLPEGDVAELRLDSYALVVDGRNHYSQAQGDWLRLLPPSGLVDVDGERLAYHEVDAANGVLRIPPGGRGLHGTQPRGHASNARVWIVDGRPAATLATDLAAGDATLELEPGAQIFPPRSLLLVDRELLHTFYVPGRDPNQLSMPRRRPRPGDEGEIGEGILRARFGTAVADHIAGTLAYSFPARWEDRYVPESDDPAGAWLEIGLEEPGAYWRSLQYDTELPDPSHAVRVLARAGTARWEDSPEEAPGLILVESGRGPDGGPVPLRLRDDRLDLRVSFDWGPGAFDPATFRSTGWTVAPRLRRLLVDYLAESRLERVEEIVE